MLRKIIEIDEEKCNGCGVCADACHEGAIEMIDGKAKLTREDYCDGLGDCLPACPTGAISFVERKAKSYDEEAVRRSKEAGSATPDTLPCGCPGSAVRSISHENTSCNCNETKQVSGISRLSNWPVQIKLVPPTAPYFDGAKLLIAADCTAYAYGSFHEDFIKNNVVLIGCPKLDGVDYTDKLAEIIKNNDIKSVTIARMEVPCCKGIEEFTKSALQKSGKFIPWQVVVISADGSICE